MPQEILNPWELELWKPTMGTSFHKGGTPHTVIGKIVVAGKILVFRDGSQDSLWMGVAEVARLVRDQGGAT